MMEGGRRGCFVQARGIELLKVRDSNYEFQASILEIDMSSIEKFITEYRMLMIMVHIFHQMEHFRIFPFPSITRPGH